MSAFDQFWAAYPRTGDKALTRAKFEAITSLAGAELQMRDKEGNVSKWQAQATPEELIAGAKAYAMSINGEEKRFIKHPTTWLNHGCWMDFENRDELAAQYDARTAKREQHLKLVK